jgi:hypothetical protein
MTGIPTEVFANNKPIILHITKAIDEGSTADRKEAVEQLHRPFGTGGQLADDQHRPLIAEHL